LTAFRFGRLLQHEGSVKAAIYARISTQDQTTQNQLPDLEALASRRGFDIVQTFSENVSAVKARPEFDQMIASAHRGKFDVLLVWSLDRLPRSMVGALQTVLDLDRRGVQVVSYKEPWLDTGGPVRSLLNAGKGADGGAASVQEFR
jgi:DNA invertase Pin-like site-specific DNA recombinase